MTGKRFFILSHTTKTRRPSMRLPVIGNQKKKQTPKPRNYFCTNCGMHCIVYYKSYRYKLFKRPRQIHRQQVLQALLSMIVSTYPLAQATSKPFTAGRCTEEWLLRCLCTPFHLPPNDFLLATVTDHTLSSTHFLRSLLSHHSRTPINMFTSNNYFPSCKLEYIKNMLSTNNAQFKSLP